MIPQEVTTMDNRNEPEVLDMRVRNLKPGLILARPVDSDEGCRLLPKDTVLNQNDIQRLEGWKKRIVYVYNPEDLDENNNAFAQAS
jgi:hypothetical protein